MANAKKASAKQTPAGRAKAAEAPKKSAAPSKKSPPVAAVKAPAKGAAPAATKAAAKKSAVPPTPAKVPAKAATSAAPATAKAASARAGTPAAKEKKVIDKVTPTKSKSAAPKDAVKEAVKAAPVKDVPAKDTSAKKSIAAKAEPVVAEPAKKAVPAAKKAAPKAESIKPAAPAGPVVKGVTKEGISYTKDFDAKFLQAQRTLLLEEREALTGQAIRLEDEANSLIEEQEMGDVQFDDEGGEGDTMVVERERDLALSAQARQTIADIDAALVRLTTGAYGYSVESGRPIPRERLEAIPWATVLVEEKVGGIGRR
jgi:RNA polymerase-binding transcription factor DksA